MSETSEERRLYAAIFPQPSAVSRTNGVFLSFDALQRLLPDRILLARIDDIFRSWCDEEAKLPSDKRYVCDQLDEKPRHILYKHDEYEYLAAAFPVKFDNRKAQYCIKLANNGFIYPSATTIETNPSYNDSFTYHGTTGWSRLSAKTLQVHFKAIVKFAGQFFKGERVDGQVLYNDKQERIDFRFKTSDEAKDSVRLVVTFEPGFPYHWHDEDKWDKL
mmetsp:Transcript_7370/g.20466  ORF Transcript_7370/g.20466 Transcript_7370/m.20466 type:complete len:218 (-) Transcript_7370:122-775(-)